MPVIPALQEACPDQSSTPPLVATQDPAGTTRDIEAMGATAQEQGSAKGWSLLQVSGAIGALTLVVAELLTQL